MSNLIVEGIRKWTDIKVDINLASEIIVYLFSKNLLSNKRIIIIASLIILNIQNCFA